MPARNVIRCRPKSANDLDLFEELGLVYWIPLVPGTAFKTFAAMRAAWDRHGERILHHYVDQRPGTRPFAMWALGELPLPPLKHEPSANSLQFVIEGRVFYSAWHYFGTCTGTDGHYRAGAAWGECEYLRAIGVVDAREAALASAWVDDRYYGPVREDRQYQTLATD